MQTIASIIDVSTAKKLTDEYIQTYCQLRSTEAAELGVSYARLWQSIEKLLLAGGKRFRPYMVLATYQAYHPEGNIKDVIPAAVAQEFLHSAMLIHDDIIDRDTTRYGVDNIAGQYNKYYSSLLENETERTHMSLSAALLAGDVLLADAHKILRKTNRSVELVNLVEETLNSVIFEVIGGELLDSEMAFATKGSISADTIARYKTASYSFVGPITTGALLAEAPETDINILREFSIIVGIGYQLRDDLLGTFGDEHITGKSATTDIQEGKRTYLIEQFEKLATEQQLTTFSNLFHRYDITTTEIETIKSLLINSGARASVEQEIMRLKSNATKKIRQLSLSSESKTVYKALVEYCLEREL